MFRGLVGHIVGMLIFILSTYVAGFIAIMAWLFVKYEIQPPIQWLCFFSIIALGIIGIYQVYKLADHVIYKFCTKPVI